MSLVNWLQAPGKPKPFLLYQNKTDSDKSELRFRRRNKITVILLLARKTAGNKMAKQ